MVNPLMPPMAPQPIAPPPPVRPHVWHWQLQGELRDLEAHIHSAPTHDAMTRDVQFWYVKFKEALELRHVPERDIVAAYLVILREILIDSFTRSPLDHTTVRGSDGNAYLAETITRHQNNTPEPFCHRSPLNPNDEAPFTIGPHFLCSTMLHWLEKHTAEVAQFDDDEKAEESDVEEGLSEEEDSEGSDISDGELENIRQLALARHLMAHREQEEENNALFEEVDNQLHAPFAGGIRRAFNQLYGRIDAIYQRGEERANALGEEDEAALNRLWQRQDVLDGQIAELGRQNARLREQLDVVNEQVDAARNHAIRLQILVNETRQELKKKENGWLKALGTALLVIGGCAFVSWALQAALAASSVSVSVQPISNSMIGVSICG